MPPTLKKLEGHIASGSFVCPSVHPSVKLFGAKHNFRYMHTRVFNFHMWIPHEKIGDTYFFLIRIMPLS